MLIQLVSTQDTKAQKTRNVQSLKDQRELKMLRPNMHESLSSPLPASFSIKL